LKINKFFRSEADGEPPETDLSKDDQAAKVKENLQLMLSLPCVRYIQRYEENKSGKLIFAAADGGAFVKRIYSGGFVGLVNHGNTCFFNTGIQCLAHLEPVICYFLSGRFEQDLNEKSELEGIIMLGDKIRADLNEKSRNLQKE
jgi:hypothetical protein